MVIFGYQILLAHKPIILCSQSLENEKRIFFPPPSQGKVCFSMQNGMSDGHPNLACSGKEYVLLGLTTMSIRVIKPARYCSFPVWAFTSVCLALFWGD
jgi:hypothetical protein